MISDVLYEASEQIGQALTDCPQAWTECRGGIRAVRILMDSLRLALDIAPGQSPALEAARQELIRVLSKLNTRHVANAVEAYTAAVEQERAARYGPPGP